MTYYTRSQRGKNDSNTLSENNITAENKTIKKKKLYNCSACRKLTKQITNIIGLIIFTFFLLYE